eukprot:Platyproteum_vivax@DN6763_c0_g1_i2.p2
MSLESDDIEGPPTKFTVKVRDKADLWKVVMKSKHAKVVIPELEFEIQQESKRRIDCIYNHVAAAIFNLGTYLRETSDTMPTTTQDRIIETVVQLNLLLDVDQPWTFIVEDPFGNSDINPRDGRVLVESLDVGPDMPIELPVISEEPGPAM